MPWSCLQCDESIEDQMSVCWFCGTNREGRIDPNFQSADDYKPEIVEEKIQFRVSSLLGFTTVGCLALFLVSPTVANWSNVKEPTALDLFIFIGLLFVVCVFLFRYFLSATVSIFSYLMNQCLLKIRSHQSED